MAKIENKLIFNKVFWGKMTALKMQMAKDKRIFFHIAKNANDKWEWLKRVKFAGVECAAILRVLQGKEKGWNTFHSFKGNSAKIWVNRHEDKVVFKFDDVSKALVPSEATELAIILQHAIVLAAKE